MTAGNEQIVVAFEENGLTPDVIAEKFEMDETVVKAVLMQNSSLYRKDAKVETSLQFKEVEASEMKDIILNIARYEESDQHLKFKAAKFILEDRKGRLDVGKVMPQFNFTQNIVQFNERLQKVMEARERSMAQLSTPKPAFVTNVQ